MPKANEPEAAEAPEEPVDHSQMDHSQMDHAAMGHTTPPEAEPAAPVDHSQMDHSQMGHAAMGHDMPTAPSKDETPPARALEGPLHAADAIWGSEAMQPSRDNLVKDHGEMEVGTLMVERFEARIADGEEGYLWDAQAWYGGDIDKIWLKTEGEGEIGGSVEDFEVQALWSHAIAPFFDLQAGARLDIEPETRSHLVLGIQGLVPYMWHVDAALFLSDRGDLTARVEAEYDQKITQSLILQPRAEFELSASDIPERGIGAGLTKVEAGVRLRYEFTREFAPYLGAEYEAKLGDTADIARAAGDDPTGVKFLAGIRFWF
ncbi:copper resistance protein B [Pontixanthobacter gangjinensis]